jgi:tellurium resistance protein TerD
MLRLVARASVRYPVHSSLVNDDNQTEVARYDLTEDASTETAMLFGELYRHNAEWKFRAVGQGYAGGLASVCAQYGINAS